MLIKDEEDEHEGEGAGHGASPARSVIRTGSLANPFCEKSNAMGAFKTMTGLLRKQSPPANSYSVVLVCRRDYNGRDPAQYDRSTSSLQSMHAGPKEQ
eukprot:2317421-Pleurochrysis_carterae.AAC.1